MELNMMDQELISIIQQAESENQELLLSQQKQVATCERVMTKLCRQLQRKVAPKYHSSKAAQ